MLSSVPADFSRPPRSPPVSDDETRRFPLPRVPPGLLLEPGPPYSISSAPHSRPPPPRSLPPPPPMSAGASSSRSRVLPADRDFQPPPLIAGSASTRTTLHHLPPPTRHPTREQHDEQKPFFIVDGDPRSTSSISMRGAPGLPPAGTNDGCGLDAEEGPFRAHRGVLKQHAHQSPAHTSLHHLYQGREQGATGGHLGYNYDEDMFRTMSGGPPPRAFSPPPGSSAAALSSCEQDAWAQLIDGAIMPERRAVASTCAGTALGAVDHSDQGTLSDQVHGGFCREAPAAHQHDTKNVWLPTRTTEAAPRPHVSVQDHSTTAHNVWLPTTEAHPTQNVWLRALSSSVGHHMRWPDKCLLEEDPDRVLRLIASSAERRPKPSDSVPVYKYRPR